MCCFSPVTAPASLISWLLRLGAGPAVRVSGTRIFARMDGDHQVLVYSMTLSVPGDVAMVLPLPIPPGAGEDALQFVDLEGYPAFFDDMESCFLMLQPAGPKRGGLLPSLGGPPRLKVHAVGSFEASFVPGLRDFSRLDPRFRLGDDVWRQLPAYDDYGFAVFKLAKGRKARIHPMAFRFPTRAPDALFFPTVHVHDGAVHRLAEFDHRLFYQGADPAYSFQGASRSERSIMSAGACMKLDRAKGLVVDAPLSSVTARGELENVDTWIPVAEGGPQRAAA